MRLAPLRTGCTAPSPALHRPRRVTGGSRSGRFPGLGLTYAHARHKTPYGMAEAGWRIVGNTLYVAAVVPPNTTAEVTLPGGDAFGVESGSHRWKVGTDAAELPLWTRALAPAWSTASGATASERMSYVLELLQTQPVVSVAGLARVFAVSEVTIRSDLASLARQGRVVRTRGGARTPHRAEVAFDLRLRVREREKGAIARAAAAIVGEGETIALDSSTTAYYLARELREKPALVVVTNGVRAATALAGAPGVSVIVPGGRAPHRGDVGRRRLRDAGSRGNEHQQGLLWCLRHRS